MPAESTPSPGGPGDSSHALWPGGDPPAEGNIQDVITGIMALHKRIFELEKSLVASGASHAPDLGMLGPELRKNFIPAWRGAARGAPPLAHGPRGPGRDVPAVAAAGPAGAVPAELDPARAGGRAAGGAGRPRG